MRKTYIEESYNRDYMKKYSVQEMCSIVWTPVSNLNEDGRDLLDHRIVGVEDEYVSLYMEELDELTIDSQNYDWCMGSDFDDYMFEDIIDSMLADHDHYIIYADGFTWDRRSGYTIRDSKFEILNRDWDCVQYIAGGNVAGDVIAIREASHDAPMGYMVYILGVEDAELDALEENDSIFEFIGSKISDCILF